MMQEILTDIFTWAWFSEPHGYNFNGYLIRQSIINETGIFPIERPGPYTVTVTGSNGCRRTVEGIIQQ